MGGKRKYARNGLTYGDRRTDRTNETAKKRHQAKGPQKTVAVKASFGGRLAPSSPRPVREYWRASLNSYVEECSRRGVNFSMVFNLAMRRAMETGQVIPIDRTSMESFFKNTPGAHPLVQEAWAELFPFVNFKQINQRLPGLSRFINYVAHTYATNVIVAAVDQLEGRLKKVIKGWMRKYDPEAPSGMWWSMFCAITGTGNGGTIEISEISQTFVETVVEMDVWPFGVDVETWGNTGKDTAMQRMEKLFQIREVLQLEGCGFTLVPVCAIKRHHITIDNTILAELLERTTKIKGAPKWIRRVL